MTAASGYTPSRCDLCGGTDYVVLLDSRSPRSLRSDRALVARGLRKWMCARCGLVRSGYAIDEPTLYDYYAHEYTLSAQPVEHYFYTPAGPVARSAMLCDWIVSSMGEHRWRANRRCLEVGAGWGALMLELRKRFPGHTLEGIELNEVAAELAQQRGLAVRSRPLSHLEGETFDLVYSVAVIEHVASPTEFLRQIHHRLRGGGWLVLCQPTQDVPSYDLFFCDHVHHFGTEHLRQYARKCEFRERGFVVGHEWMPNFSLHVWEALGEVNDEFAWCGPPGFTTCPATAKQIVADMARLDATLHQLRAHRRRVAVFGLHEVYWLTLAYSTLGDCPLVCGLDDQPNKPEHQCLNFPVRVPEDCARLGVQDVILTMNKVYYEQARRRLELLGLTVHPVLS